MSDIDKFKQAQESVYGPLAVDEASTKTWIPPPNSGGHRGRYLWTDAFGVINFITLSRESNDVRYLLHARRLAQTVHDVLGRTRNGKSRLPGASDENPVGGGLRIGKEDDNGPNGDGQYHHYLTLWMFALNRLSLATKDKSYNEQAISLAKAIHPHFLIDRTSRHPHMVWKIAMDMSKPLVWSQGNLDPLDGYTVFRKLQATSGDPSTLKEEIADYKRIIDIKGKHTVSTDTLDLGMTLWTSHWLADKDRYFADLSKQGIEQAHRLLDAGYLEIPTSRRLAFRDYGTCLGVGCVKNPDAELQSLRSDIINTWEKYRSTTPNDLRPISEVMRAAALIPGAFRAGYFVEETEMLL